MTFPHFDARPHIGFIASYGYDSHWPGKSIYGRFSEDFYNWLDEHCLGPVLFTGQTTAHWESHVEFSHPEDLILYKLTCNDHNISESVNCNITEERTPREDSFRRNIYIGKNVDKEFLRDFLTKYPYNTMPLIGE